MFGSLGFTELMLILVIVLIIFGAGKLPQLGEGVGKAIKGFKKSVQEAEAIEAEAQEQGQNPASGTGQAAAMPIPDQGQSPTSSTGSVQGDISVQTPQTEPMSSSKA